MCHLEAEKGAENMNRRITLQQVGFSICERSLIMRLTSLTKGVQIRLKHGSVLLVILVTLLALSASSIPTTQATMMQMDADWGRMPLYFVANQGQTDNRVAYYVQGSDKTLYFTPEGVTFALTDIAPSGNAIKEDFPPLSLDERSDSHSRWVVKLDFVDANNVAPAGLAQTDTIISYFKGSPADWRTGLPTYSKIIYPDLWEGIDLVYSGTVNQLKHEFIVQPGTDPARIRLTYHGATVRVNDKGQLDVSTPVGGFQDEAPLAYQEVNGQRVPVSVKFALEDSTYGFQLGAYNPALPLIIDPETLVYCGFIGGTSGDGDFGTAIAVDVVGNAYVTGYAHSTEATFPVTVGPDLSFNGIQDAFVVKVKADGTGLVYAGYIGGSGYESGNGIAVDKDGNAYITGGTYSSEATFPVTVGPDLTFNGTTGKSDAFVAKVNPDGTKLLYAGYIGGSGAEGGNAIAVDSAGNAYITGSTYSYPTNGFPVLVGPSVIHNGYTDAFVAKVKADGTGLLYSGYIGGGGIGSNGFDEGWGIAVDSDGFAYVTGITSSTETTFPVTVGPDLTYNGGPMTSAWDGFVAKVASDGSGLVYCGYIGGAEQDYGTSIAVDAAGNAYVTGYTNSTQTSFPVMIGPDLTYNGDYWDAFVTKVKPDGSGLLYSGYIGGDKGDTGHGIAVDASGNAYIAGGTSSTQATFPVVGGPDLTHNGYDDAFVAKVKADGTQLLYAGYIGGSSGDNAHGIAIDSAGSIYITGDTSTEDGTFPAIVGPDLTFNGSYYNAFVAKIFSGTAPGTTFTDVSSTYWAWSFIERLYKANITGGCDTNPLIYCPENQVTRAQMAVFLEKGMAFPSSFNPPNVAPTFTDTVGHWAEDWIEALKNDGVTSGCATGLYCPEDPVTRAQMALFLLKAKHGASYSPPDATGVFADVPVGYWADKWIEQLAAENITGGCATGLYCPNDPVTRAQMAVFLVKTFNLP
jgi:hypothetical protein